MEQREGHAVPPVDEHESWRKKTVLTFDGGGIRGYASLLMLEKLMIEIGEIERSNKYSEIHTEPHSTSFMPFSKPHGIHSGRTDNFKYKPGAHVDEYFPCHYFDLIAGTSTGGLIATMLSRFRMSVGDCLNQYAKVGKVTFENPRKVSFLGFPREKHSEKPFVNAMQNLTREKSSTPLAAEEDLSDEYRFFPSPDDLCRTFVVAIQKAKFTSSPSGEIKKSRAQDGPYLFRSYLPDPRLFSPSGLNCGVPIEHKIWMVCRATTAATFYFESQTIGDEEYCDGGVGFNNPTWLALNEMDMLHENGLKVIASFGTGLPTPSSTFKGDKSKKLHIPQAVKHIQGVFNTAKGSLTGCEVTHHQIKDVNRHRKGESSFSYYRLNISEGLGKVKLDEWKARRDNGEGKGVKCSTLKYLENCVENEWAKTEVKNEIKELASMLVDQRRKRVGNNLDRYRRFATCVIYECPDDSCKERNLKFLLEGDLRDHLLDQHPRELAQNEWLPQVLRGSCKDPRVPSGPC